MKKKANVPWYKQIVSLIESEKIVVPRVTGVPKGKSKVKIGPTIPNSWNRQAHVIKEASPSKYQLTTDVLRAALGIGLPILHELDASEADPGLKDEVDSLAIYVKKMTELNSFSTTMYWVYQLFQEGALACDDDGDDMQREESNLAEWNRLKRLHLDNMRKKGMGKWAEDKLKKIENKEKVINLMELSHRGGAQ